MPVIPVTGFYAQKIVYIDECLYNYFQRENSASNHKLEDLSFYDITYEKFKNYLPQEYKESINIRMVEHLLYSKTYSLIKEKHLKKEIIENINKCKKDLEEIEEHEPWNERLKRNVKAYYKRMINPGEFTSLH